MAFTALRVRFCKIFPRKGGIEKGQHHDPERPFQADEGARDVVAALLPEIRLCPPGGRFRSRIFLVGALRPVRSTCISRYEQCKSPLVFQISDPCRRPLLAQRAISRKADVTQGPSQKWRYLVVGSGRPGLLGKRMASNSRAASPTQ